MVKHGLKFLVLGLAISQPVAALATTAPGSTAKSSADRYQVWRNEAVRALAARNDANSVATAAALSFTNPSAPPANTSTALQLIARAGDLAPDSAAIGWLHLQLCATTPSCDSRDAATVLRWVDPDNSAAWLAQLSTAHKDKDIVEVDRVLGDMAQGTRFDLYYNQIMVLMYDALDGVRRQLPGGVVASDTARLTALAGVVNAEIIPPFSALIDSCRESTPGSERREDCLKLAKIMQRGDTVIVQMVGFGIERRLISPESKEARNLNERRHLLEWRLSAASKLDSSVLPWTTGARTRTRLAQMRIRPREEDVCIALLREHKMPLEPAESHR
ncbi:MAG TPA: hypothetical protein VK652_07335 [Steroidobacteraceae bacterium]|nr:hypothetical protein [Steroidobacteraceae bacterium]